MTDFNELVPTPVSFTLGSLVRNGGRIFRVTGIGGNTTYLHCAFEYLGTEREWATHNDGTGVENES